MVKDSKQSVDNTIILALYACTEREEIDTLFSEKEINDYGKRIRMLDECMGVEKFYGTPENLSAEEEYDFECAVFVEGSWRLLN